VNVYLESSAALRDVLGAEHGDHIRADVQAAETVVASRLTLAEVSRRMTTLRAHDPVAAETVAARAAEFFADSERWVVDPLDDAVWRRCERPFPIEPLRTLDAIHLPRSRRYRPPFPAWSCSRPTSASAGTPRRWASMSGRSLRYELATPAALSASSTRASRNGTRRMRTPVASKIAFPTAASTGRIEGSPAP
jgi:hypothetical protein